MSLRIVSEPLAVRPMEGFSERSQLEHHRLYQGYVERYRQLLEKITVTQSIEQSRGFIDLRSIKVDFTFALAGARNHQLYFDILGGDGVLPEGLLMEAIQANYGTVENYLKDLRQTALVCRGWAWTIFDLEQQHLTNHAADAQNAFPVWNAVPILAIDMYEHAFFYDYGNNKNGYLDAFFKNLNWGKVQGRYERALAAVGCL